MTAAQVNRPSAGRWIFFAGAPGSRWSAVARAVYSSADCDNTDAQPDRQYARDGEDGPMHTGAYWDPGMEFGQGFDRLDDLGRAACEAAFDAPFSGEGRRVVKSHTFCHHLPYLRRMWPDSPVVVIYRPDADCLQWWLEAGGFGIRYPDYGPYYRDTETMAARIAAQNRDLLEFLDQFDLRLEITDSVELCRRLGIRASTPKLDFGALDVRVGVAA